MRKRISVILSPQVVMANLDERKSMALMGIWPGL